MEKNFYLCRGYKTNIIKNKSLIFYHLPKSGGTTFCNLFSYLFKTNMRIWGSFDGERDSISAYSYFIDNKKISKSYIKEVKLSKKYMTQECKKRDLDFINTEANFFYIKIPPLKLKKLHQMLMKNKILVRSHLLGNFKFINNTIRITLAHKEVLKKLFIVLDKMRLNKK